MDKSLRAELNELIETSKDGEKGFLKAAEDVDVAELKAVFLKCAERCRVGATQLQAEIRSMGGEPETEGSLTGAVHRGWVDIKAALTGRDAESILSEVERGEDYAKKMYDTVLKKDLPPNFRALVQRQYEGVVENHDLVRQLRDRYRSAEKAAH